jgi:hypothetical protein
MNDALDPFDTLTADLATRLRGAAGFAAGTPPVPVLTERLSDLTHQLQLTLTSRSGLALVVGTPEFGLGAQPEIIQARVAVRIFENVLQCQSAAGAQLTALRAAWLAYFALLRFAPDGWSGLLPLPGLPPVRRLDADEAGLPTTTSLPHLLTYEVVLGTWAQFTLSSET